MSNPVPIFTFNHNLSGTYIDNVSKTAGTPISAPFIRTEKGNTVRFAANGEINGYGILSGVKTIIIWIKPTTNTKLILAESWSCWTLI